MEKWTIHDKEIENQLKEAGYGIFNHSAVEICHWTKEAITTGRTCYKNKFYGISTAGCMQITQAVVWCPNRCIYCWRPNLNFESYNRTLPEDKVDPPELTLEKLRELRKKLLIGYFGNPKANKELLKEIIDKPQHVTFSLSGEPLLYPYVTESISYIKKNWPWVKSIFVVTSGQVPEALERMRKSNVYPTQLYISFTGPNKELYKKISVPLYEDYWERFIESLEISSKMRVRRVARITIIKGYNDSEDYLDQWAELMDIYKPHFIEIKAFMLLGYSRLKLNLENMPSHKDIVDLSRKFEKKLDNFNYMDEDEDSRIVVLKNISGGMDIDPIINSVEPNV
ncbi:MAG: tRNA-modifying enzyme [Candidatus Nanoclepta minutus]|uniref:tRNA-modifying enzyme n=1 Tax=Candidatus Nanoclepta minutus TaxID=1940235 RepID=A0A397WMB7_9ARCH|nr:MAG: tRNA-modifying enzyme [Candidatus Nanoclepta minutus]